MSRTIRRTKALKYNSRFEKDYTHKRLDEWFDVIPNVSWHSNGMPLRPLEEKEFIRQKWRYHSDKGCENFKFEDYFEHAQLEDEGTFRMKYKNEILKWLNDPEYEIMDLKRTTWWDYY